MRIVQKGATSQTVYVEVKDSSSTTGATLAGLAFNTASLVASYARNGAARTAITLATQTASGAWSSGGFVAVDGTNMPGVYRLDVPDAAFASGAESVVITLRGAANMVQVSEEVQLTAVNLQDAVRGGLTALPNANAEAAGGLYTRGSGAGQINQNASGQVDSRTVTMATDVITAAAIQADAIGAAEIANGAIDAATFAAGAIDAAAIAAGAISSSEFAQAAADEVWASATRTLTGTVTVGTNNDKTGYTLSSAGVQAVWDALTSALTTVGSIGKLLVDNLNATVSSRLATAGYTAPPSVASISTQVWTEPIPGAFGAGSAGAKLNSASAAGDPWATTVPGAYGAGTAGNRMGFLDVAVSSRATSAGAGGAGAIAFTYTVYKPDGTTPLGSCAVWVSTDLAGTNVVAGTLYTNDSTGRVTFMLDTGTYFFWRQHPAYTFVNPDTEAVS